MKTLFLTTAAFAALVTIAPIGNAHAQSYPNWQVQQQLQNMQLQQQNQYNQQMLANQYKQQMQANQAQQRQMLSTLRNNCLVCGY
jgi:hypothetical protein